MPNLDFSRNLVGRVIEKEMGRVKLLDVPENIIGTLGPLSDEIISMVFSTFEEGDIVKFDVQISGPKSRRSSKVVPGSESLVTDETKAFTKTNGEDYEGWQEIEGVWFAPDEIELFNFIKPTLDKGGHFNIAIDGESGYGKTSRANALAEYWGLEFKEVNCGVLKNPMDFFGVPTAPNGDVKLNPSSIINVIQEGNAVILFDEFNRAGGPAKNGFYSMLDHRRCGEVFNYSFTVGPKVLFIATQNEGLAYTDTFKKDKALRNRFGVRFTVGIPPKTVEVKLLMDRFNISKLDAERIVNILTMLREDDLTSQSDVNLSTKVGLETAELVANGAPLKQAFNFTIVTHCPNDIRKHVEDRINENVYKGS